MTAAAEQANRTLKKTEALHRTGSPFADAQAPFEELKAIFAIAPESIRAAVLNHYMEVAERLLADMRHSGERDSNLRRS